MGKNTSGKLDNHIQMWRSKYKMTQADLGKKVGVSRQTIISIEKNKYTPSLTLAFELALAFDCSIDDLFDYETGEE
ncbi:transcriptional regulator [Salipaludibacillus keqinensis]|uniref:Transcriptional regulator n=1 Tax=Salipaludibacillus keqinensis TaxID=2045207 RepID=A0A323TYY8_9BACI|nr:helix-turn-helix transcriptional regulator [Salipaludibacillus keqinensis]PYZ94795.1 transcriptional regulator [Salipaludibacillus keqinensis]